MDENEERGIGERGPDKQPRDFNPKSLFNLKQFQKPVPSVNSGVNWTKIGIILASTIIAAFAIWKIWNRKKNQEI
ncbi:MAG: hypothetical protein ACREAK_07100 [Nitrosarchaeum sp.]